LPESLISILITGYFFFCLDISVCSVGIQMLVPQFWM
jgi:hypothetical protein